MICIIDYDIGNVNAIVNMLDRIGIQSQITSSVDEIERASKIILPGNGSFDACMENLSNSGLIPLIEHKVLKRGTPLLGICVGAQMLGNGSEEGVRAGLGWVDMETKKFPLSSNLRVPHMGWNQVKINQHTSPLAASINHDSRFYFVHSYYMKPKNDTDVLFTTEYGLSFASAVSVNNILGVQFHPEKSHRFGKQLLSIFGSD